MIFSIQFKGSYSKIYVKRVLNSCKPIKEFQSTWFLTGYVCDSPIIHYIIHSVFLAGHLVTYNVRFSLSYTMFSSHSMKLPLIQSFRWIYALTR